MQFYQIQKSILHQLMIDYHYNDLIFYEKSDPPPWKKCFFAPNGKKKLKGLYLLHQCYGHRLDHP